MSTFFRTTGEVVLRRCDEVEELLKVLRSESEGCDNAEVDCTYDGDRVGVGIHIYGYGSYGRASAIDDAVLALEPYVIGNARFESECDEGTDFFYIGEDSDKAESEYTLADIQCMMEKLQPDELSILLDYTTDKLREKGGAV